MPTSSTHALRATLALSLSICGAIACHHDPPRTKVADVERCERGAARAGKARTAEAGFRTYFTECANVFVEPGCRDAMAKATKVTDAVVPCQKAYCPILPSATDLELCQPGFKGTGAELERAWPPFQGAVLDYDAKSLAPRVVAAMLGFYGASRKWKVAAPKPSAAAPAGSTSSATPTPLPAPSASVAAPAPSASAGPSKAPVVKTGSK